MERTCRKCGETKPIEEFVKCKNRREGIIYLCKLCHREDHVRYREDHRLELILKSQQYRLTHIIAVDKRNALRQRKNRKELTDTYVIDIIAKSTGLDRNNIKYYPQQIENYRYQILIKRLLKQKKNEKTCTS